MKTRIVLYGENNKPLSVLGDNPQTKVKKAWDLVVGFLDANTSDTLRVESVDVWDDEAEQTEPSADTPQTDCGWK